jgi:hypothetical protein
MMKKKLRQLLEDSRLSDNTEWASIQKNHQQAKKKWEKAKSDKEKARAAYKQAADEGHKKGVDKLFLYTRYHQAKAMVQYYKLGFKLAEYQQKQWLESFMANQPVMLMMDPDKLSEKSKKTPVRKKQDKPNLETSSSKASESQ